MTDVCAVSVDLDEIRHYHAIHGLPADGGGEGAVYDVALRRAAEWARGWKLPLTLFAVGVDLRREEAARALRSLVDDGHVVENHSLSHRYDLTRLERGVMEAEIEEGALAIERVTGRRPQGFRAPGYNMTPALFAAVGASGARFDSSVFPCPIYYAAKAAALAVGAARGRRSQAILDHPRVLWSSTAPHRLAPDEAGGSALWELPIQVTPGLRLPFIGSALSLAGARGARWLARACRSLPFVNLELHGMDFLDAADGLGRLVPYQPELRVPLRDRLHALDAALDELTAGGAAFTTLSGAVDRWERG